MPSEFGGKWETECLNIRFPLSTLLCAGYSDAVAQRLNVNAKVMGSIFIQVKLVPSAYPVVYSVKLNYKKLYYSNE